MPVVAVNILSKQGYFAESFLKKIKTFSNYRIRVPASFPSPSKGDYAERAHIITPAHDTNKGIHSITVEPNRRNIGIGFIPAEQYVHRFLPSFSFFDEQGKTAVGVRTNNQVDQFFLIQKFRFQPFCHTTQYCNEHRRF